MREATVEVPEAHRAVADRFSFIRDIALDRDNHGPVYQAIAGAMSRSWERIGEYEP